MLVTKH